MARVDIFPCSQCCPQTPDDFGACDCEFCLVAGVPTIWSVNLTGFTDSQCDCAGFNFGQTLLTRITGDNDFGIGYCVWENTLDLGGGNALRIAWVLGGGFWSLYLIHEGLLTCGGVPGTDYVTTFRTAFTGQCCEEVTVDISITTACDAPTTLTVTPYSPGPGGCICAEDCPDNVAGDCEAHPWIRVPCCENALPCVLHFEIVDADCAVAATGVLEYSTRLDVPDGHVYCVWDLDIGRIGSDPDCPAVDDNLYAASLRCHTTGGVSSWELGGNNVNNSNNFNGSIVSATCDPLEIVVQITIPAFNGCPECNFTIIVTE